MPIVLTREGSKQQARNKGKGKKMMHCTTMRAQVKRRSRAAHARPARCSTKFTTLTSRRILLLADVSYTLLIIARLVLGSLLSFLRTRKNHLRQNPVLLLEMCLQVCEGMAYLEAKNYIH